MSKKMNISSIPIIKEDKKNTKTVNAKTKNSNINKSQIEQNKIKNNIEEKKLENEKNEEKEERVENEEEEEEEEKVENADEEKGENEEEELEEEIEEEEKEDNNNKIIKNKINLEIDNNNTKKININNITNKNTKHINNINEESQINIKKEINYKLKAEALEKENLEIKNNLSQKKEEVIKLSKINEKLRKNLEKVSVQVDSLLKKANDNAINRKKTKNITSDNEKNSSNDTESLTREKQLKNSLSMIQYLTKDNKKLRKQIENLSQISPIDPHNIELLKKREEEIITLNEENRKLKDEINQLKYSEKTIENLKKKIILLNDTINRLNEKNVSLKEENKNYKIQLNNNTSDNNTNLTNIQDNKLKQIASKNSSKKNSKLLIQNSQNVSKVKRIIFHQRSASVKNFAKRNIKFCSTTKNFYKLFNQSEQKAISTLFESKEDLDNFKQKINILENRNSTSEKQLNNEIKGLKKAISEKDEQIKYLNIKIKGDNAKIKILKNNSKEKESHNLKENKKKSIETEKTEKNLKDFGFKEKSKNKNEQIEKLNLIIEGLKKELNNYYYEKKKEKEFDNLNIEIGLDGLIDVKKIISDKTKKFKEKTLKISKNESELFFQGIAPKVVNKDPNKVRLLRNPTNDFKRGLSINNNKNSSRKPTYRVNRNNNNAFLNFHQKGNKK